MNENAQMVYDYLVMNPDKHDQTEWVKDETGEYPHGKTEANFCGTTMCAAGAAVLIVKGQEAFIDTLNRPLYMDDYQKETWVEEGSHALGISYEDGARLFGTMNKEKALDLLNAIAQDDMVKFRHIYNTVEDTYDYS